MHIVNPAANKDFIVSLPCIHYDRNSVTNPIQQPLLQEHTLHVEIKGGSSLEFVCIPDHLPELILGHLVTEGYIQTAADVNEISLDKDGHNATVYLSPTCSLEKKTLAYIPATDFDITHVFHLADAFAGEMPLHNLTYAAHSCFLAYKGEVVFSCEDLGRHNALDKAVGYAVLHGLNPVECILYSSGRMPIDMVSKAIRAGFPVLISKGAPTANAVALAQKYGLTLICSARRDGMKIYSDGR